MTRGEAGSPATPGTSPLTRGSPASTDQAHGARHVLVLVAGPPGTGKSWLASLLLRHLGERVPAPGGRVPTPGGHVPAPGGLAPQAEEVSLDLLKERLWDSQGFTGPQEKEALNQVALEDYERALAEAMGRSRVVVSDYPFSDRQRGLLAGLCREHGFTPLTVRLVAGDDVLYERQRRRDLDPSRHPGHVLTSYRPGQEPARREEADALVSREELARRCAERGYASFSLGETLEVDVSDLDAVDYPAVLAWVEERVRGRA